jgi:hypothetical protein
VRLRPGWIGSLSNPQAMVFLDDHPELNLRGQAKGIEQVIKERHLWRDLCSDGLACFSVRLVLAVI